MNVKKIFGGLAATFVLASSAPVALAYNDNHQHNHDRGYHYDRHDGRNGHHGDHRSYDRYDRDDHDRHDPNYHHHPRPQAHHHYDVPRGWVEYNQRPRIVFPRHVCPSVVIVPGHGVEVILSTACRRSPNIVIDERIPVYRHY